MVRTLSSSSSSSCASFGSFDDLTVKATVKFLCSYGGRIVPRHSDGKLRYVGGDTRVLAVDKSIPFSELQVKLRDLCGWESVSLRCQLPTDDLYDALVSITSDEDIANFLEEFDLAIRDRLQPLKISAFLFPQPSKTPKPLGPSPTSTPSASVTGKPTVQFPTPMVDHCCTLEILRPVGRASTATPSHMGARGRTASVPSAVHHGNHKY